MLLMSSAPSTSHPLTTALLAQIQQALLLQLPQQAAWLTQGVHHALAQPGKALRPRLTLLAAQWLHPQATLADADKSTPPAWANDELIALACVPELIHTATLLHDDVLDQADLRRGQPTVRAKWGNQLAILGGDWLLARASQTLATLNHPPLVGLYANVLAQLCEGETLQHMARYQSECPTLPDYEQRLAGKTASLFSAACQAPALWLGSGTTATEALAHYGYHLGLAFQWVDDWLDYTGDPAKTGKPVLDDVAQGLLNGPIVLALAPPEVLPKCDALLAALTPLHQGNTQAQLQALALAALEQAHTEASAAEEGWQPSPALQQALQHLKHKLEVTGALQATQALACYHQQQAVSALQLAMDEQTVTPTPPLQQVAFAQLSYVAEQAVARLA
jgi:geranylgeranyl pyrophosphate synthase